MFFQDSVLICQYKCSRLVKIEVFAPAGWPHIVSQMKSDPDNESKGETLIQPELIYYSL